MVLNPDLFYALCKKVDRDTKVINAGQPLEGSYQTDPRDKVLKLLIGRRGETYVARCPFCNDQRVPGRLWVNHRYGLRDEMTGLRNTNLWKCYNEECQHDKEYRREFRETLLPEMDLPSSGPRPRVPEVRLVPISDLEPCEFPGSLLSVKDLPDTHVAVRYLRDRGFDIDELAAFWDVSYADSVPSRTRGAAAQDRIIVPVRQRGIMVGWQARFVGELDWSRAGVPKYLTYFPKSRVVYGLDEMGQSEAIVLVEGVTDVWRYGYGAVCGLGKKLSLDQGRLLAEALRGRPLVLMPDTNDPDALKGFCGSAKTVIEMGHSGPIGLAPLPGGVDPATMSRTYLRKLVEAVAREAIPRDSLFSDTAAIAN